MNIYTPNYLPTTWLEGGYNGGRYYVTNGRENGPLCESAAEAVRAWEEIVCG